MPETAKYRVKKAVTIGGVTHRPVVDGKSVRPVEVDLPVDEAEPFVGRRLERVSAAGKQQSSPADKQFTGGKSKSESNGQK